MFSLYGPVRRPTAAMMDTFDVLLVDLQDLGCRIYTFITTLRYVLEAAAHAGKSVWVLDRPNPAGRPVEGSRCEPGWESFVGAGPLPMRHGLTMAELARWFVSTLRLNVDCQVIAWRAGRRLAAPGYGWPLGERTWINPSPNAPNLWMARCYAGLGAARGHHALRRPRHDAAAGAVRRTGPRRAGAARRDARTRARSGSPAAALRQCWFEPTFHKHVGKLCAGLQVHVEDPAYYDHERVPALAAVRARFQGAAPPAPRLSVCGATFPTSTSAAARDRRHQRQRAAAPLGRRSGSDTGDLDALAARDEAAWRSERQSVLLY